MKDNKIPYTKNTKEVRILLEKEGFFPLSFFQGKEYIYPVISHWGNSKSTWVEKEYSTCNQSDLITKSYLKEVLSLEDFIIDVKKLH